MISLLIKWRNIMFGREKLATLVAEFLGTGVLTLVVLTVYHSQVGLPFFVSLSAGVAFAGLMLAFGKFSGAVFNPAIALGLWTVRKLSTLATILYVVAEMLGAWAAVSLFGYLVNTKLVSISAHYSTRVLIAEALGAFVLAMVWAASLHQKHTRAVSATMVGLAVTGGMLVASSASMALLNPALALGMKSWIWGTYILGPVVGAVIAFNLYDLVFNEAGSSFFKSIKITTTSAASPAPKVAAKKKTTSKKRSKK